MRKLWMAVLAAAVCMPPLHAETEKQEDDESIIIIRRHNIEIPEIRVDLRGLRGELRDGMRELRHHLRDTQFHVHRTLDGVFDNIDPAAMHEWQLDWTMAKSDRSGDYTEIDETRPTSSNPEVYIRNISGFVKVNTWDRDEVRVKGTLGENVERLQFEADDGDVEIRVIAPKRRRNPKIRCELTVDVPENARLEVVTVSAKIDVHDLKGRRHELKTVSGGIEVHNSDGDFELKSVNGGIQHEDARGDVDAEAISGSITLSGNAGRVEANSVSGSVRVSGVHESIEAESISGSVRVEGRDLNEADFETVSGSIRFSGSMNGGGELRAETLSGSVTLRLSDIDGRYHLETHSGGISNEFGPSSERKNRFGPGRELRFTIGEDGARYHVETFSGSIRIEQD